MPSSGFICSLYVDILHHWEDVCSSTHRHMWSALRRFCCDLVIKLMLKLMFLAGLVFPPEPIQFVSAWHRTNTCIFCLLSFTSQVFSVTLILSASGFTKEIGRFVLMSSRAVFPFEQVISVVLYRVAISVLRVLHFSSSLFCSLQARSRYWAVDYIWIGPYLRQQLYKVICSSYHTHYCSHWLIVLWRPCFPLLSGRFPLFGGFICEEKMEKRWVWAHICYHAATSDSHRRSKMLLITAFHIIIVLKAASSVCFLFVFFSRIYS